MLAVCANLSISVAQTQATEQVINLVEIALPSPLDELDEGKDTSNPPMQFFQATISGNMLHVVANTGMIARMQVENNTTGEVVEDKSFTATTVAPIYATGSYTLYIQSGNTMVAGEFEVE